MEKDRTNVLINFRPGWIRYGAACVHAEWENRSLGEKNGESGTKDSLEAGDKDGTDTF